MVRGEDGDALIHIELLCSSGEDSHHKALSRSRAGSRNVVYMDLLI